VWHPGPNGLPSLESRDEEGRVQSASDARAHSGTDDLEDLRAARPNRFGEVDTATVCPTRRHSDALRALAADERVIAPRTHAARRKYRTM
jgi:hypothetical protein